MNGTYSISGMTCSGCQAKVQHLLQQVPGVTGVEIDLARGEAVVVATRQIPISEMKGALNAYPKYQLNGDNTVALKANMPAVETKDWLTTYRPVLLIFLYVALVSLIAGYTGGLFDPQLSMRVFMSGFFFVFSFFKMLDVKGFATSYAMYDIVAMRWKEWGYFYAILELALGICYAIDFYPLCVNIITLIVMTVSIIGVLQSVLNKRKIQCACLGAVFDLPMSTVTIIEDALMIAMAAVSTWLLLAR